MCREHFLLTFLLIWCFVGAIECKNLYEEIRSRSELSEMAKLIEKSRLTKMYMEEDAFMAFVPTNKAMEVWKRENSGNFDEKKFLEYHTVKDSFKIQDSPAIITSFLTGNAPLYVTKKPSSDGSHSLSGHEHQDYYINNAKVISANIKCNAKGYTQYLHIIDEVLIPTIAQRRDSGGAVSTYPDALSVLEHPTVYGFREELSIRSFRDRVKNLHLQDIFKEKNKSTFFLPVDQRMDLFTGKTKKNPIDKQVVYGHIVPNEILFTRTSSDRREPYNTLVNGTALKVYIKLIQTEQADTKQPFYYVESNTVKTDPNYMKGIAQGRIIKGNIPVKNGVLHLIDRPLMMVAGNIGEYLQEEHGIMSEFYKLLKDFVPEVLRQMSQDSRPLTVLAPSNRAFTRVNKEEFDKTKANTMELKKIVNLHIMPERFTTDDIPPTNGGLFRKTTTHGKDLLFSMRNANELIPYVTVEGGGVNATITSANVIAKNGVIHIIDRILGIPSQTVLDKLATDPSLSSTYFLVSQTELKDKFNDTDKKITFFAPSNDAWETINRTMPSEFRKLFMNEYPYHVTQIMERHMIVNEGFNIEQLVLLTSNKTHTQHLTDEKKNRALIQMTRDKVYFAARVRDQFGEYYLEWQEKQARIERTDVECVNGVIHVIDKVLMKASDVTVNSGQQLYACEVSTLLSVVISIALARSLK